MNTPKTALLSIAIAIAFLTTPACNEHAEPAMHDGSNVLSGGLTDMEQDNALAASCFQAMGRAQWSHLGLSEEQIQVVLYLQQGTSEVDLSTDHTRMQGSASDTSRSTLPALVVAGADKHPHGRRDSSTRIAGSSDGVERNTSGYGQLPDSSTNSAQNSSGTDHGMAKGRIGHMDPATMQELESVLTEEQLARLKKLCAGGTDVVRH